MFQSSNTTPLSINNHTPTISIYCKGNFANSNNSYSNTNSNNNNGNGKNN